MHPVASVAKLNPKISSREFISGVRADFTPSDIAAALAASLGGKKEIDRLPYLLGLAKINNQFEVLPEIGRLLRIRIAGIFVEQHWKTKTGVPMTGYLAEMALWEYLYPPRCLSCNGRGHIYPRGGAVRECATCGGGGNQRISNVKRGKMLHMSDVAYANTWADRYSRHIWPIMWEMEGVIFRQLRRRLSGA